MKLNKIIFNPFVVLALTATLFTNCAKTGYSIIQTTNDSDIQIIIGADELNVNNEFDQAVNEALLATSISYTTCGEEALSSTGNPLFTTIAGAVIDTTQIAMGFIKITYFGKTADNTKGRTGEIDIKHVVENGHVVPWKTPGAIAEITFTQYEIIELATNKSLWLDGTATITNVSGGLLRNIANSLLIQGDSLVDKARAHVAFTYNDNVALIQTWIWDFSQHRVFTIKDASLHSSIKGDTVSNETENVSTWGATRSGEDFYTSTSHPVLQDISESFYLSNPVGGVKIINGIAEPMTCTYGVDEQGNPVSTGNPYGYKITWFRAGSQEAIVKY